MKIQFVTDRDYGAPQLISVSVEQTALTDFDQFVDLTAVFHDAARHIKGRVYLPMMSATYTAQQLQREIMRSYDANQYTDI
jgi:hypothetical protein